MRGSNKGHMRKKTCGRIHAAKKRGIDGRRQWRTPVQGIYTRPDRGASFGEDEMGELLVKFDGQTRSFLIGGMRFHLASDYVFTGEKRDVLYRALGHIAGSHMEGSYGMYVRPRVVGRYPRHGDWPEEGVLFEYAHAPVHGRIAGLRTREALVIYSCGEIKECTMCGAAA